MTLRPGCRGSRRTRGDAGFVLVGVVMFILALTILGLSLFSLSGYEAQFLGSSLRRSQGFYDGIGAMDRAKHVLAATSDKDAVDANLDAFPGVVSITATQDGSSTGAVDWTDPDKHITIRVTTNRDGDESTLEAAFAPGRHLRIYRETINSYGPLVFYLDPASEHENVHVGGGVLRQNGSNFANWATVIDGAYNQRQGGVPAPEVAEFLNHWRRDPRLTPFLNGDFSDTLEFRPLTTRPYGIFEFPAPQQTGPGARPEFGFSHGDTSRALFIELVASDKPMVWLLPNGGHFAHAVRVVSNHPNNTLIIVAGTSSDTSFRALTGANTGLWFEGGLSSSGPIILVSDGSIAVDRTRNRYGTPSNLQAQYISIFGRGVYVRGPWVEPPGATTPQNDQYLTHPAALDETVLNRLFDHWLLPNTLGGRSRMFTLVPGSFRGTQLEPH
jgi:hypothetical protein